MQSYRVTPANRAVNRRTGPVRSRKTPIQGPCRSIVCEGRRSRAPDLPERTPWIDLCRNDGEFSGRTAVRSLPRRRRGEANRRRSSSGSPAVRRSSGTPRPPPGRGHDPSRPTANGRREAYEAAPEPEGGGGKHDSGQGAALCGFNIPGSRPSRIRVDRFQGVVPLSLCPRGGARTKGRSDNADGPAAANGLRQPAVFVCDKFSVVPIVRSPRADNWDNGKPTGAGIDTDGHGPELVSIDHDDERRTRSELGSHGLMDPALPGCAHCPGRLSADNGKTSERRYSQDGSAASGWTGRMDPLSLCPESPLQTTWTRGKPGERNHKGRS